MSTNGHNHNPGDDDTGDTDDFGFDDDVPFVEPTPDEDAWEAYLDLALERMGADGSTGLTNNELAKVEDAIDATLPYELGMLLVMGVPGEDPWRNWADEPEAQWAEWNDWLRDGLRHDVEHHELWWPEFGPRPDSLPERLETVDTIFPTLPKLFPICGPRCMPLSNPVGMDTNDGNPVFSVSGSEVVMYGADLAGWLHADFDVPLPMWPTGPDRAFPFWYNLA